MPLEWFRQDKPAALDRLRLHERPLMATTLTSGALGEPLALHLDLASAPPATP